MIKPKVTEERKAKEHRGEGSGANYKPYIKTNEFNSLGTTCNPVDWKNGRTMELLSLGEMYYYYILRFDDKVVDIREQFPLDLKETLLICKRLGIKHPKNNFTRMTSDFLVDYTDGTQIVYSIKRSKNDLKRKRTKDILKVEEIYWNSKGIKFELLFAENVNVNYVTNIRLAIEFYNKDKVFDEISYIKHLIANKKIKIDLCKDLIDYGKVRNLLND